MAMGEDLPVAVAVRAQDTAAACRPLAILLQARRCDGLLLLTQRFESILVKFVQFSLTFRSFLAVLGVIVLRFTQAGAAAPLPGVGLSAAAAPFSGHVALHDDLPFPRAAAGGADRRGDHADRAVDLRTVSKISAYPRKEPLTAHVHETKPGRRPSACWPCSCFASLRAHGRRKVPSPTTRPDSWRDCSRARIPARGPDTRPGWQQHARALDQAWAGLEAAAFKIRAWSAANHDRAAAGGATTCSAAPTFSTSMRSCRTDRPM